MRDADEGEKAAALNEVKEEAAAEQEDTNDYSLLDQLVGFLDMPQSEMLPILSGYFHKIVASLVAKHKQQTLEYLLLKRNGAIFDGMLNHLQQHSLATLLIELLQVQIKPEQADSHKQKSKLAFYNSDGSDAEGNEEDPEGSESGQLSPDQIKMKAVLEKKGSQIVHKLLDTLSEKNTDLECTLNAHSILQEFCDSDYCFHLLTAPDALARLIGICCSQGQNTQNLPYALHLLSNIISQFGDAEKEISDERKAQIQTTFPQHFADMAYTCILLLRGQDSREPYVNQSSKQIRRVGVLRIRAIELLKTLFVALSKSFDVKEPKVLSALLRKKTIETMLFMLREFPFCSISHQQATVVLNALKEAFDAEDVKGLRAFVKEQLGTNARFEFNTGLSTPNPHMGQVIQLAFELRSLTQQALDDADSDADEEDQSVDEEKREKMQELDEWERFCREKVTKIEKVWNRKLEDSTDDDWEEGQDQAEEGAQEDEDDDCHEVMIGKMLDQIGSRNRMARSHVEPRKGDAVSDDLQRLREEALADAEARAKDTEAMKNFGANTFWKVEQEMDLDALIAEADL